MDFRLLGPLEVLDGNAPVRFAAGKQRALLALLLLNANRTLARDRIIDDLWGDDLPESAQKMVQIYVSQLRKALPLPRLQTRAPGYLLEVADEELDLVRFERSVAAGRDALSRGDARTAADLLRQGLALWRGPALAEFAEPFAGHEGARLEELRAAALEWRVEADFALGDHGDVVGELESLIARHPLRERLRSQHMLALYRSGRHAEALDAYQAFRRMLDGELGIEPPAALRDLERRMLQQDPSLDAPSRPAHAPRMAAEGRAAPRIPAAVAEAPAGRARELVQFERLLAEARSGERRLVFVTGEAGIGKTTIVERFLADAESQGALLVARGQCVEHRGAGEAYLPVLEALGRLARRPGAEGLVRVLAQQAPTWLAQMPWLIEDDELESVQRRLTGATHERMLREMLETLEAIGVETPVVLVLEDLHWSDPSTIDLLEAVAKRHEPVRLLVLGTYRRGEAIAQDHPVYRLEQSLRSRGLCAQVALGGLAEDALDDYATALLGAGAPAGLGRLLHERTRGNPLFAKTLLESWLEQGLLDEAADLDRLAVDIPDSIRDLIEQMLGQLDSADQELLEAASVAGQRFSAASVAAALDRDTAEVEARCGALARAGRFLERHGEDSWPDGTIASGFAFSHDLQREVVYERLPAARRARLHGNVGKRLEIAYSTRAREIAPQLADHLVRAGDVARAVVALRLAAEQAFERLAHREALDHLTTGLEMLERVDEGEERWAAEFALQSMLGAALIATRGWSDPGAESAFLRARELADRIGQNDELGRTLFQLGTLYEVRGDYERADPLLHQSLTLSGRTLNSGACTDSNELLACSLFHQGSFAQALEHAERGLSAYDGQYVNPLTAAYGDNAGASCHSWAALSLWFLGYPDQAGERARQAVQTTMDPRRRCGRATALVQAAIVDQCGGDAQATLASAEAALEVAAADGYIYRTAMATILRGWALAAAGQHDEGVAELESGLALSAATGARMDDPYYFGLLGEACLRAGKHVAAAEALAAALDAAPHGRQFFYEPEIHRLRGEIALAAEPPDPIAALECFTRALEVARYQGAKPLELRAALSAAPLLVTQGRGDEAREIVSTAYASFSAGVDTPDLEAARSFLRQSAAVH
jgi:DNA-binding SARP family transcriptional activator/predicted ATPase